MKKIMYSLGAIVAIGFITVSFTADEVSTVDTKLDSANTIITDDAKEIIDNKCYACHNSESKNKKGKKKLAFDTLDELSVYKQISKYEGIHEVLVEGEMPPEKFLEKYPDKVLTAEEKETMLNWAKSQGDRLAE
ncbi:MAG: heme-binding domain-containing protein [Bacteroidota bacterium]